MAIPYKKLNDKLTKDPLTASELKAVDEIEAYVDKEIVRQFTGNSVRIDLLITNFDYNPNTKQQTTLPNPRKEIMRKELEKRFKAAGWKIKIELCDDYSSMGGGSDYWILSGK